MASLCHCNQAELKDATETPWASITPELCVSSDFILTIQPVIKAQALLTAMASKPCFNKFSFEKDLLILIQAFIKLVS